MDGSGIISRLIQAKVVKLAPISPPGERLPLPFAHQFIDESQGERLDRRTDEQVRFRGIESFFEKQAKGKQRLSSYAFEPDPASFRDKQWVGKKHRTLRRQQMNNKTSVDILTFDDIE
jgi:hypothetical protein